MPTDTVFRQVYPVSAAAIDPTAAYGRLAPVAGGRPAVRANMIASADGAAVANGLTKALGSPADRVLFFELRSLADIVLVGAGTVRAERYGPVRLDEAARARRVDAGLPPVPPIAVVTG